MERHYVDELGGMNVFFVMDDDTLVTPPLTGTILPGITRDSLITLAAERGVTTIERPYSHRRVARRRRVRPAARGVRLRHRRGDHADRVRSARTPSRSRSATARPGAVSTGLRTELVDIQRGAAEDPHGWVHRVV